MKHLSYFCMLFLFMVTGVTCKEKEKTDTPAPPIDVVDTPNFNDVVYGANGSGTLFALNAKDGTIKWRTTLYSSTNYIAIHSSPTLVDDVLYIGCPPNKVYAVHAKTGVIKWTCDLDVQTIVLYSSPLVVNGMLYIGQSNKFYGINASTGVIKWRYSTSQGAILNQFDNSSPCYHKGIVYVNCINDPKDGLYGFDAITGVNSLYYRQFLKNAHSSSPCVYNDVIYSVQDNDSYGSAAMFKLNISTWSPVPANFFLPHPGPSSPTVFNGSVYIGASNFLYAYDDNPSNRTPLRWRFEASSELSTSSPTADSSSVYIASGKGVLYAIKTTDGTKQWEFDSKSTGTGSSPTLANKVVYYGTGRGVHAINAETGALIWENTIVGSAFSSLCVISKTGEIFHSGISGVKN